jgi:hypothetical protein
MIALWRQGPGWRVPAAIVSLAVACLIGPCDRDNGSAYRDGPAVRRILDGRLENRRRPGDSRRPADAS